MFFVLFLYFVNSPLKDYDSIKENAHQNEIEVVDCYNEPALMKQELFRDLMHLNDNGAHVWSAYITHRLKPNLITE